jgi:predicted Zn-ribbon and HTH transcriptional regulator
MVEVFTINGMVKRGEIPPSFVYINRCSKCGVHLSDYSVKEELVACPWCLSEKKPKFEKSRLIRESYEKST